MTDITRKTRQDLYQTVVSDTYTPIEQLKNLMKILRHPLYGCDWDKQQDFKSIKPYTLEEAYEVADAIEKQDITEIKNELGDLLLQVIFHAQIAEDQNHFNFDDVASAIVQKMLQRHPHVFNTVDEEVYDSPHQVNQINNVKVNWEDIKESERKAKNTQATPSILDDVALALPALLRAEKLQKRAARVGFDWPNAVPIYEKILEEISEFQQEVRAQSPEKMIDEMGDILFAVTNLARHYNINPEQALHRTNQKFIRRFQGMEKQAETGKYHLKDLSTEQQEQLWQDQKKLEQNINLE